MSKIIDIIIDEEGNATVETIGYRGKGCAAVQAIFEKALGVTVKKTVKPEFNQTATKTNCIKA